MTIQLKPGQEQAIQAAIEAGAFRSVDVGERPPASPRKSRLWELRKGLSLGDLSIKGLIEEGRE